MIRDDIDALLPFLANDTLTGDERDQIQSAVAADPDLQAELAALKAIRTTMQTEEAFSPGEMGLARLMRAVETTPAAPVKRPWLWQAAAAVLLAVVLGQGLALMRTNDPSDPGGYQLAGDTPAFTIAFHADTTESQLRDLLLLAGVEIVHGPSALGLYQIAPLEGVTQAQAHATLAASELIESIETSDE